MLGDNACKLPEAAGAVHLQQPVLASPQQTLLWQVMDLLLLVLNKHLLLLLSLLLLLLLLLGL
jgi:hypothetical protein